jgi:hypothetical protein
MKVVVSRSTAPVPDVIVTDVDDLKDLRVLAGDLDDHDLDDALVAHGMGRVSEGHAWLEVETLRRSGGDAPAWQAGFAAMIAYASSKGWVDTAAGTVRAHLVRSGDHEAVRPPRHAHRQAEEGPSVAGADQHR